MIDRETKTVDNDLRSRLGNPCKAFFEDAPIGVVITTPDGRVLFCNKTLLGMMGYSAEEVRNISTICVYKNPADRDRIIAHLEECKKIVSMEIELIRKDGGEVRVRFTSVFLSREPQETILSMLENITQSRRTEEDLAMYEAAVASSICPMAMCDINGNLTYVNAACLSMWGYEDAARVLGQPVTAFASSRHEALRVLSRIRATGAWVDELTVKRSDGTLFDVQLSANVVMREGRPVRLMASFIDISRRKRAEEALRESECRHRMALDAVGDAIALVDKELRILFANRTLKERCAALGFEADMEGRCLLDAYPVLPAEKVRREYQSVFDTGQPLTTRDKIVVNGMEIFTETRKSPIYEGDIVVQVLAAVRDVTEKIRLEEKLIASERKYRNIFENNVVGIYQSTLDGRYLSANPAISRMFGYDNPEEFMAGVTNIGAQLYVDPADRQRAMQTLRESDRLESFEVRTRRRDGSLMWTLINSRAVRDTCERIEYIEGVIADITGLKEAQEALRLSEERFAMAFRLSPAPMAISTLDEGRLIDVNNSFTGMLGYKREELIGLTSGELRILESPERWDCWMIRLRLKEPLHAIAARFRTKSGEIRDTLWSAEIIVIGGVQYMLSFIYDMTDRLNAERELQESRQQLSDIINFLPDATFVIDRDCRVIAWNTAMEEMTGIGKDEMIGRGDYAYTVPFYGEPRRQLLDLLFASDPTLESRYCNLVRKGRTLYAEAHAPALYGGKGAYIWMTGTPLYDGQGQRVGAIESIRDITERKQMEEKLAESERRHRLLAEAIQDVFWMATPDIGQTIYVSPAYEKIWGRSRESLYLSPASFIDSIHPEDRARVMETLERHRLETSAWTVVYRIVRPDGSVRWIEDRGYPVRNEQGQWHLNVGVASDITERRQAEEKRLVLEERLRRAERLEAIGTLAGGIAHDFNNILTSIVGFTELTRSALTDPELIRNLDYVSKSCDRAKHLINEILAFSRCNEESKTPVRLDCFIEETVEMLRGALPSTIRIETRIDDRRSTVMSSSSHLHQILMNLCTNAAHAMKEKGGILKIALEKHEVRDGNRSKVANCPAGKDYVKLTVRDSGHGISPSVIDRIFDPFFTTKPPGEGTGLGLSVVYGIVKDQGGWIDVRSSPGRGAVFEVFLPEAIPGGSQEFRSSEEPGGHERILFVDDEESIVHMGEKMLKSLGYEVTSRSGSIDALDIVRVDPQEYDLVITDATMPDMTGLQLAEQIHEIRPELPIILCTGYSELVNEAVVGQYGIRCFMMKPFSKVDLAMAVRRTLDTSRAL
jgi:PAS domain S-box-containing protein